MYTERKIRLSEAEKKELKDFETVLKKHKKEIEAIAREALAELKARVKTDDAGESDAEADTEDPYEPYP